MELDEYSSMFFPITESAHDQSVDHQIVKLNSNTIQRVYELNLEEGQKLTDISGVFTYKNDNGYTEALKLSTKVSDKAVELPKMAMLQNSPTETFLVKISK